MPPLVVFFHHRRQRAPRFRDEPHAEDEPLGCLVKVPFASETDSTRTGLKVSPRLATVFAMLAASRGDMVVFQNPAAVRANPSLSSGCAARSPRPKSKGTDSPKPNAVAIPPKVSGVKSLQRELGEVPCSEAAPHRFAQGGAPSIALGVVENLAQ